MFRIYRKISSLITYFTRKVVSRVMGYRLSRQIMAVIMVAIAIFLFGGGVYDIVIRPDVWFYPPFHPHPHEQLLGESLAIMMLYALGTLGLILIYRSGRYRRNPHHASLIIWIGMALLVTVFITIEVVFYRWKTGLGL